MILRRSKSVCYEGTHHDMIVVVKSAVYNLKGRTDFRAYMKKQTQRNPFFKVGYVFSIGLPREKGGRIFQRDGYEFNLQGASGNWLEEYNGKHEELMKKVNSEIDQFDDIILADYIDTYFNLSWKTATNLRWLSRFCNNKDQGNFFMVIDDDHRVDLKLLKEFAVNTPVIEQRRFIHGRVNEGEIANRSKKKKYTLTIRELPWDAVPAYPHGMSYLIGADIIDDMAIATAFTKHNFCNEDVYLGFLAHKLNITLQNVKNMYDHLEFIKDLGKVKPMVAMHVFMED